MDQYIGEIRAFSFPFPPKGWAACNGQIMPISQNQALYALLGNTYGGNGTTTFALPDLRGRVPLHKGAAYDTGNPIQLGEKGGEEAHSLTISEMPHHTHLISASTEIADQRNSAGNFWAQSPGSKAYSSTADVHMNQSALDPAGAGQAHPNMQPYTVLNYCIAITGLFPIRN